MVWRLGLTIALSLAFNSGTALGGEKETATTALPIIARLGISPMFSHEIAPAAGAFSPDGRLLAIGGSKQAGGEHLLLLDSASPNRPRWFKGHADPVQAVAFSADGKRLAAADSGKVIIVWDVAAGKILNRFHTPEPCRALVFAPAGKSLVSREERGDVRRWDLIRNREIGEELLTRGIIALAPDGRSVASGRVESVFLWDLARGEVRKELTGHDDLISAVAYSPDSRVLASADIRGGVRLWNAATGQTKGSFKAAKGVRELVWSANGKYLITLDRENIRCWNPATGKEVTTLKPLTEDQTGSGFWHTAGNVVLSTNGRHLVDMRSGQRFRLWTLPPEDRTDFPGQRGMISRLAFSADGRALFVADAEGTFNIWNLRTFKLAYQKRDFHPRGFFAVADGRLLVADKDSLLILDQKGRVVGRHPFPFRGNVLSLSADRSIAALLDDRSAIALWNPNTGKKLRTLGEVRSLPCQGLLSGDGKLFFLMDSGGSGTCWDTASGKALRKEDPETSAQQVLWAQRQFLVLEPEGAGSFVLRDFVSRKARHHFHTPASTDPDGVQAALLSPDERMLLVRYSSGQYRLWETASGQSLRTFTVAHPATGTSEMIPVDMAFSADGRIIALALDDFTILLVDTTGRMPKGSLLAEGLSPADVEKRWQDLGGANAVAGHQAVWDLVAAPGPALAFFQKRLRPVSAAVEDRVRELIRDLGTKSFAARAAASRQLEKLADLAEPALIQALSRPLSLETRRRIELLLRRLETPNADAIRAVRTVWVLEQIGDPEALKLLEMLSRGAPASRWTREARQALERIQCHLRREP